MAEPENDVYLRSDSDKGEGPTLPDTDLRLRSYSDKETPPPAGVFFSKIMGVPICNS